MSKRYYDKHLKDIMQQKPVILIKLMKLFEQSAGTEEVYYFWPAIYNLWGIDIQRRDMLQRIFCVDHYVIKELINNVF